MKDIFYYKDEATSKKYDSSKTLHREDGPAIIRYYEDGSICYEDYYIEGELHREDGPAQIGYYKDGSIRYENYCIEGKELSKEDYFLRQSRTRYTHEELISMSISDCKIEREFSVVWLKESVIASRVAREREVLIEIAKATTWLIHGMKHHQEDAKKRYEYYFTEWKRLLNETGT